MSQVSTIARGDGSGIDAPRRVVIRDEQAWRTLWKEHAGPDAAVPPIDFATRLVVGDALTRLHIALVSAAAVQFQGQVGLFRGWEADKPCYRCFVGDAFDSDDCDTCAEQGVLGALTATVGGFAALMAIRAIVGIGEDVAGSLFLFDGAELEWRKIRLPKDPNCRTC